MAIGKLAAVHAATHPSAKGLQASQNGPQGAIDCGDESTHRPDTGDALAGLLDGEDGDGAEAGDGADDTPARR